MSFDEDLPLMLWTARPDMSCEQLSRAWLDFTGFSSEQAQGDGWARAVHPEDLARWLDTCVRAFDAREPYEIEYRLRRSDGEYRWIGAGGAAGGRRAPHPAYQRVKTTGIAQKVAVGTPIAISGLLFNHFLKRRQE